MPTPPPPITTESKTLRGWQAILVGLFIFVFPIIAIGFTVWKLEADLLACVGG